jgi:hypothetical protein
VLGLSSNVSSAKTFTLLSKRHLYQIVQGVPGLTRGNVHELKAVTATIRGIVLQLTVLQFINCRSSDAFVTSLEPLTQW